MAINFANVNLEVIDINTNASPDIFVNKNGVTFTKRVIEDLSYPQTGDNSNLPMWFTLMSLLHFLSKPAAIQYHIYVKNQQKLRTI